MTYYASSNSVRIALNADNLADAMTEADNWITYTGRNLYLDDGNEDAPIMSRTWYNVKYDATESGYTADEIIDFGDFGFFGAWSEYC